jgi:ArsR family transcriptional regulator, lead/cadmium/zinc/bismuth-responsive transcriptional repressor
MEQAPGRRQLEAAADIFKALADPQRLQILLRLAKGELNVTQLGDKEAEKISTVSARRKVLRAARLVKRRRDGQAIIYAIADDHVLNLVGKAVDHAGEAAAPSFDSIRQVDKGKGSPLPSATTPLMPVILINTDRDVTMLRFAMATTSIICMMVISTIHVKIMWTNM